MKAKHAIARIKGLLIWQKIFCALIAVTLIALMIPNGLRANAEQLNANAQTNQNNDNSKGVNDSNSGNENSNSLGAAAANKEFYSIADFFKLGSAVNFEPESFNMDKTNGYFKVQTAKVTVEQAIYFLLNNGPSKSRFSFDNVQLNENGEISKEDMAMYFATIGQAIPNVLSALTEGGNPYLPFGQLDYYEQDVYGNHTVHMEDAIEVPDLLLDAAELIADSLPDTAPEIKAYIYLGAELIRNCFNTIIPSNTDYKLVTPGSNALPMPEWPFRNDGSMFMLNFYWGTGDNILDRLKTANLTATRVIPMNQGELADPMFSSDKDTLLKSNNAQANAEANIQPYFMNWDIDLWGTGYMPVQSWQSIYGDISVSIPIVGKIVLFNFKPLPIASDSEIHAKAYFYDVEGLVPVHLDFSGAYVNETMRSALRHYGWSSTDFINASVWTKNYWEWTPTWYVYQDIMENVGPWIYGGDKNWWPDPILFGEESEWNFVYKDEMIRKQYCQIQDGDTPDFEAWTENVPFSGPHWMETNNDNWFGTIDKETTVTFSVYPVSPRGHVVHEGNGETILEDIFDVADPVDQANVMIYNEYDIPLFSFFDQHYAIGWDTAEASWGEEPGYFFGSGKTGIEDGDWSDFIPDWCMDTWMDHAEIFAFDDYNDEIPQLIPDIYIPLRVNWDQFDASFASLFDYGYLDFSVERLMFADVEKFMNNAGIESFEVTYFEDGQPLFEPQIVDARYTGMLGIPMVTNGTITTGDNRLVTGFNCFLDFARPFGETDAYNTFQDIDNNFTVSSTQHWYQCQIKANMKPGFAFTNWIYDLKPISADTYKGEPEIIIKEELFIFSHSLMAGFVPVTAEASEVVNPSNADGTAIYGGEAVTPTAATPDGNAPVIAANPNSGTAQTGDTAGLACAILALVALAAGITATRKIMVK